MKRTLRIILFSIVFLAGVGMIALYFFMKRSVPQQAQCIPKNAFLVVTLNVKQLALDHTSDKHLFPENAKEGFLKKELLPITNAIKNNGGSGLNETNDVLAFMYQSGDAAFIGVAISVNDSAQLGKLMREQMTKQFPLHELVNHNQHLLQYDTSSAMMGWNKNSLLLLYPFSNHSATATADECAKLLSQTKENSLLSDVNFTNEQLNSFDAGIWIHAAPLLTFTNGGSIFKTQLDDINYVSFEMEFGAGEIDIRKIVTGTGKTTSIPYNAPLLISGEPKNVLGFIRMPLDLENKNILSSYLNLPPLANLPLGDEEIKKLLPVLDGNCSILFHDTMTYDMNYITYEYDEEFNNIPKVGSKKMKARAMSTCFGLKNDVDAKRIFSGIAKEDSLTATSAGWTFSDNGLLTNFFISDHVLTMTTSPVSDGKPRKVPEQWEGMDVYFPLGDYFKNSDNADVFFFFPKLANSQPLLGEHFATLTISQPSINGNTRSSTICQRMTNKNINALIQLEDLAQKIMSEGN